MEKITVLEGLEGKSADQKVTYGGEISRGMTGNSYYTDQGTKVTDLDTATGELQTALSGGDSEVIGLKEENFDNKVSLVVNYVQGKVIGINVALARVMVESANLKWKKKGSIHIHDLEVTKTEVDLTVQIRRKALRIVDGKKVNPAYVWQKCTTEPTVEDNWKPCKVSTVATVNDNVEKGKETWYRVATVLGQDQSEYSDYTSITW